MVGITKKPRPILKKDRIDYADFMPRYRRYEAMPDVNWIPPGYVRILDTWNIKGVANSGGLTQAEAKMVEKLLSKLNNEGKKAIQMRLLLDRRGDHHRGLDRLVNKFQRPTMFVPIDGERGEIFQKDYLKLKIVGGEIVWEEGSILEGLKKLEGSLEECNNWIQNHPERDNPAYTFWKQNVILKSL